MKLSVQPENLLDFIALQSRSELQPFLLTILGMGVSHSVIAAIRLGVFDALQAKPQTASELAQATHCTVTGMQVLLESLDGFGFIVRRNQTYYLKKATERHLTKSGGFVPDFLRLAGDINHQMILLEEDVKTGQVPNFHFNPQSDTCTLNYYAMLKSSGQQQAPQVFKWAKLQTPKYLLDVAGGPGEYSIAFCQQYPNSQADILDLPTVAEIGLPKIQSLGLNDRIRYISGNLLEQDWGSGYDLILLSNILHCLTEDQCQIAIARAFQALDHGGKILINDVFHPGNRGQLTAPVSLFSLIYYVTCGGRSWPQITILDWLQKAGFKNLRTSKKRLGVLVLGER
jgi:hypothetical protein